MVGSEKAGSSDTESLYDDAFHGEHYVCWRLFIGQGCPRPTLNLDLGEWPPDS